MVKTEVQTAVKYLEDNKIPYTIVMDNMQRYAINNGSTIIWNPDATLGVCIRINVGQDQAARKYELRTFCYDHIEAIEVHTSNIEQIKGYVTAMNSAKATVIKSVMDQFEKAQDVTITGSTGDGIGDTWNGKISPAKIAGSDFSADGNLIGATYRMESDYTRKHQDDDSLLDADGQALYDEEGNKLQHP